MRATCQRFRQWLVTEDAWGAANADEHLAGCEDCTEVVAAYRGGLAELQTVAHETVSPARVQSFLLRASAEAGDESEAAYGQVARRYRRGTDALLDTVHDEPSSSAVRRFVQAADERFAPRFLSPARWSWAWAAVPLAAAAAAVLFLWPRPVPVHPGQAVPGGVAEVSGLRAAQIAGDVAIVGSAGAEALSVGAEVAPGRTLRTPTEGALTLDDPRTAALALAADAELGVAAWDADHAALELRQGRLRSKVQPRAEGQQFVVRTEYAIVTVVGTEFVVDHQPGERTVVEGISGEVRVTTLDGTLVGRVRAGQTITVPAPDSAETETESETAQTALEEPTDVPGVAPDEEPPAAGAVSELLLPAAEPAFAVVSPTAVAPASRKRSEAAGTPAGRGVERLDRMQRAGASRVEVEIVGPAERESSPGGVPEKEALTVGEPDEADAPETVEEAEEDEVVPSPVPSRAPDEEPAPAADPEPADEATEPTPEQEPAEVPGAKPLEEAAERPAEKVDIIQQATSLLAAGRDQQAIELLESAPGGSWRVSATLGDAYSVSGRKDKAIAAYRDALRRKGGPSERVLAALGRLLAKASPGEALAVWSQYLQHYPKGRAAARARLALGKAALKSDFDTANRHLRALLAGHAKTREASKALALLGRGLMDRRRWADAARLFQPYVSGSSRTRAETALVGLIRVRLGQGDRTEARRLIEQYERRFETGARRHEVEHLRDAL